MKIFFIVFLIPLLITPAIAAESNGKTWKVHGRYTALLIGDGNGGGGGGGGDPTDPTCPTDPSDPSDPTDPTDPTDPSDPTDPPIPPVPGPKHSKNLLQQKIGIVVLNIAKGKKYFKFNGAIKGFDKIDSVSINCLGDDGHPVGVGVTLKPKGLFNKGWADAHGRFRRADAGNGCNWETVEHVQNAIDTGKANIVVNGDGVELSWKIYPIGLKISDWI